MATGTPVSYQFDWAVSEAGSATWIRLSGHHATTPIDDDTVTVTAAGATTIPLAEVITTVDNTRLVAWTGVDESSDLYDPYWSDPMITSWTQTLGSSSTPSGQGGSMTYVGVAHTTQASAGASGTKTASIAVENDAIVGFLIAVRPLAGSASISPSASLSPSASVSPSVYWKWQ